MEPELGQRYRLGDVIGLGGMGEVLSAEDTQIGREVAIKRMRAARPTDHQMSRFFREASIQGRLDHPAIVPVYELGVDGGGRPFFAMKKLSGTTMWDMIYGAKPATQRQLLRAFVDTCLAIAFAHAKGVIHRDLKPSNIILGDFGEVYVIDWGVAKVLDQEDKIEDLVGADAVAPDDFATVAGARIGTPSYMAPEQAADARSADARADVFSLGCVLYDILYGEMLHPVAGKPHPTAPRTTEVPPEIDALWIRATAKSKIGRTATARELAVAIQRFLDGDRDFELRRELAQKHLDVALAAHEKDANDRVAMREAGRAIVLDPTLPGAAELVGRMLVVPPKELPAEVVRELEAHDATSAKTRTKASRWASLGYLWMLPALIALAPNHPLLVAALVGIPLVNTILATEHERGMRRSLRVAITLGLHIAVFAHAFTPFLIGPVFAVVVTMSLASSASIKRWREILICAGILMAGVLIPWGLELAGAIEPTMQVVRGSITLTAPGLDMPPVIQLMFLSLFSFVAVLGAGAMGYTVRRSEREIRHQLQLQTWKLSQLFPTSAAP